MWTRRAVLTAGSALAASLVLSAKPSWAATDQLRIGLGHEPPDLDPTLGADPATLAVSYQNIFEGLTRIDAKGAVQPGLAKSWTMADDKLSYSFVLETAARYHDGTNFDAAHVVFALKRLLSPAIQSPQKALYHTIADVVAVDDANVKLVLNAADDRLPFKLGLPDAVIVAPESADDNRAVPLGTGPFAFVQWDDGQQILLERNEDYWGPHPKITQASFVFVADPAAAMKALLSREIDGYPDFPAPDLLTPLKGNPAFRVTSGSRSDGKPITGVWNAKLDGMWLDAPVGGAPLAGIYWTSDA